MREAVFLKNNQSRWKELEDMLAAPGKKDPDKLSDLFIRLTDDLSYARTYYPDSKATEYLNYISSRLHQEIYRNKKERSGRFIRFWTQEVPMAVGKHIRLLAVAAGVFFVAFLIGWLSQLQDPDFIRFTLSDKYVNMTEENIKDGDPMGVYNSGSRFSLFVMIMVNNVRVMLVYFMLGLLFGVGALWRIFSEGIRIGSFMCFFYTKALLLDASLAVWMHGTIEISCLIISGQAGLVIGKGIVFPGTYKRSVSLRKHAMDGMKIAIGLVPFIVIAAFIEGFLTREALNYPLISVCVILLSLSIIVTYFILFPLSVYRRIRRARSYVFPEEERQLRRESFRFYGYVTGGIGSILLTVFLISGYSGGLHIFSACAIIASCVLLYLGYRKEPIAKVSDPVVV